MSAVPRSVDSNRRPWFRKSIAGTSATRKKVNDRLTPNPTSFSSASQKVEKLPTKAWQTPTWLRSLLLLQRSSSVLTFCLVMVALITYAWTDYTRQRWSSEYQKLKALQQDERQLIATYETLKNQLAKQAESPETGLVPPNPANLIFLPPAAEPSSTQKPTTTDAEIEPAAKMPLGY